MEWLNPKAQVHLQGIGQQEWMGLLPERIAIMQDTYNLSDMQPLSGGRAGAIIRCKDTKGKSVILKILLPNDFWGQVYALRLMGGHGVCCLCEYEPALLALIIEDLGGSPHTGDSVDLAEVAQIICQWRSIPPHPKLPHISSQLDYWADLVQGGLEKNQDQEVQEALLWALDRVKKCGQEKSLLHADLGYHNLLITEAGLKIIDPTGAAGPRACDAGSLAVWGGSSILEAPGRCTELANLLDIPEKEVRLWAAIRASFSAAFGSVRDDQNQRHDCLLLRESLLN